MSILQLNIIHPSQENLPSGSERLQSEAGTERKRDEEREIAGECGR
jgi:hypothetical protein